MEVEDPFTVTREFNNHTLRYLREHLNPQREGVLARKQDGENLITASRCKHAHC